MKKQPAKVNYFFGEAYRVLFRIIGGAFKKSFILVGACAVSFGRAFVDFFENFIDLVKSVFSVDFGEIWEATKETVVALFKLAYALPMFVFMTVFSPALCLLLSAVQFVVFLAVMLVIYITYMILYFVDLIYRKVKQISNTCRSCQQKYTNPVYLCPRCGAEHTHLIPSKYGIFKRTCECGEKLPTLFFNGRGKLTALCPHCKCEDDVTHVDVTIPVVGGPSAGKTCYISMAIADIAENSEDQLGLEFTYDPGENDEYAININELAHGATPAKTSDMRLRFYRFYLERKGAPKHLISLCDVGGEVYDNSEELGKQAAFTHVPAFMMILDPISISSYREELESEGKDVSAYRASAKEIDEVLSMLITTLENICGMSAKDMLNRDIAIVFSKGDIPGLDEKIGQSAVADYMNAHPGTTRLSAQNAVCEQFLKDYDEFGFLNALKSKFKHVQFFASSALGHVEDGSEFSPAGVSEPVYWILDRYSNSINLTKLWGEKV